MLCTIKKEKKILHLIKNKRHLFTIQISRLNK